MTTFRFQRVDRVAGSDLPLAQFSSIRQATEPPAGSHRDFLTARGWPFAGDFYAAFRTTRLSKTYFDLLDAGLLDALDWLYLSNGTNMDGSIVNWIDGGASASASGVTMSGGAMQTNGVDNYLGVDVGSIASRYTLNSASAFAHLVAPPPSTAATNPIIGTVTNNDTIRLYRNSGSPFHQTRVNSAGISQSFDLADWSAGLWGLNRPDSATGQIRKNGATLRSAASTTTSIPGVVAVGSGNGGTSWAAQSFTAFGGGRALTDDEWVALSSILSDHAADMVQIAALP